MNVERRLATAPPEGTEGVLTAIGPEEKRPEVSLLDGFLRMVATRDKSLLLPDTAKTSHNDDYDV